MLVEALCVPGVVTDVSFSVEPGQCAAIVGASGSGKSVLVRALCGLIPSSGRVVVGAVASDREGWRAVQSRMGVLLAQPGLLDDLTLSENVAFKLRRDGVTEEDIRVRVTRVLDEFGLRAAADKLPSELSGGMRRRGALARALVHEPSCLLLDDPTAGLDPITTNRVLSFILDAARARRASVVLTTHDLNHVAHRADAVLVLRQQKLVLLERDPVRWARELGA